MPDEQKPSGAVSSFLENMPSYDALRSEVSELDAQEKALNRLRKVSEILAELQAEYEQQKWASGALESVPPVPEIDADLDYLAKRRDGVRKMRDVAKYLHERNAPREASPPGGAAATPDPKAGPVPDRTEEQTDGED